MSFARFVPASAKLFVRIRRLGDVDAALRRAHAWRLLPLLAGEASGNPTPADLRTMIMSFAGRRSLIDVDEMMGAEVAILASSWSKLRSAVLLIRLPDEETLDRWFPQDQRVRQHDSGEARYFRTRGGVSVFVREGIVALGRRTGKGSLLHDTARLMMGRGGSALEQSELYQELVAYLPARELAVAYFAPDAGENAGKVRSSTLRPAIDRAVVGMYEGDGRIDFGIRATLSAAHAGEPVGTDSVDRLVRLPHTTLLASATTIDLSQTGTNPSGPSNGSVERVLTHLAGYGSYASTPAELFRQLGPQVIVVWGQDLGRRGLTPQLAVMVQCRNAATMYQEVTKIAGNITKLVGVIDPVEPAAAPLIKESGHLGSTIAHVSLRAYARKSRFPSVQLLDNTEPAWTAWGQWLIVALSRDHIERILDAQHGLIPTLSSVGDVKGLEHRRADRTLVSLAQAGLASDVLYGWLKEYEAGSPSLLDPSWWRGPTGTTKPALRQLGIQLQAVKAPGVAVVARVFPGSPAESLLRAQDRIIAADGHLLDLESSNADLGRLVAAPSSGRGTTLRVLRGEQFIDVTLPRTTGDAAAPNPFVRVADAVRELASLGRTLRFATFAVHATRQEHYSARLSLRFESDGEQ